MASPAIIGSRYEIRGIVGRGGMGLVYKAFDRVVGREVALKTLADVQGKVAVEMFYKEWRILTNLHHPNIIEIFDIGEFDDGGGTKPFFVMPLLPGATLDQLLHLPGQPFSEERLGEIVPQICRGLQAIHDNGLVHRDVKPSNIFVMESNAVKIIDFGVAHLLGGNTITGLKGTVSYMAPEQIQSQECSAASDIFSLGVVCYEALCGVRPFQGQNSEAVFDAILHLNPPPVCEVNPAVSQTVSRVIHKALAKQPRHRYVSALEFGDTLQKALRGEPIPALDPSRIQPRIQRAIRAFEQGNYQMATDILSDLEAAGLIDPALKPLRNQIDQALQRKTVGDLLHRAQMGIEEEEYTLALQNAEAALRIEPGNQEAIRLRAIIQERITEREVEDWLHGAEEAIEGFAFGRARQSLRNVLDVRPGDPKAKALAGVLEDREHSYRAARQKKEELYRAARDAWENSEFTTAAVKLERVLQLESRAPDTSTPESGANYASFLSLVRSAQMIVDNTTAVALAYMAEGRHEAAAELCRECASKYPGHPVPRGLALLADSERRRELLDRMSEAIRAISAECDLEKKLDLLRQAVEEFPAEPLFDQWMRPVRDRLAQVRAVAAKAQAHEERGRFQEALEQWRMLQTIYPEFAGLPAAIERASARAAEHGEAIAVPASANAAGYDWATATAVAPEITGAPTETLSTSEIIPLEPRPEPAPSTRTQPVLDFIKLRSAGLLAAMPRLAAFSRRGWNYLRSWIRRSPHLFQKAGWPLATGLAVVAIIAAALIASARHKPPPTQPQTVAGGRARVVLRASDPDVSIRIGDTVLSLANGQAQTELPPATYPLSAEKDGYEPFTGTVKVALGGVDQVLPPLRPLKAGLYISADFQQGRVALDDRPAANFQNGEFHADDLAPGDHKLFLSDGHSEARLAFSTADGQPPQLKGPVQAKELKVFVVTALGRTARVTGNAPTDKISIDAGVQAENLAGVFQFAGLSRGSHQVIAREGKEERGFAFDAGPRPLLRFAVISDRNVGGLVVTTGLERFQVFLDGTPYDRPIRDGLMSISNLAAKSYRVRIVADGYESMEHDAVVKKGGSATAAFTLVPVPQFAALAVHGLPPRTQILIDGIPLSGIADPEGNFNADKIPPGEHSLEFRNPPQYKSLQLRKTFVKRETLTITGAEARLEINPAEITITSVPDGAQLEIQCGQAAAQRVKAPYVARCIENRLTATASADGYRTDNQTLALTPGAMLPMHFSLVRNPVAAVVRKQTCSAADLAAKGWSFDQGWHLAKAAGAAFPCGDLPGSYEFSIRIPKATVIGTAKAVGWTVQAGDTNREFVLEKKSFFMKGGARKDVGAVESEGAVTFRILVEPDRLVHQIRQGNSWQEINTLRGDFRKLKVLFPKDTRISGFSFAER